MAHQNAVWIGLGVGITCLLMNITVIVLCYLSRKKVQTQKPREAHPVGFVNPLYDEQSMCKKIEPDVNSVSSEVNISVSPWQAYQEHSSSKGADVSSFSNPLYGMTS
uniref:MAM and LDL-receptor class A domain-containing protein 1-like n=1 Tax=Geotrypetes seraphini TaxID=260995 RepID=A0A6P8QIE9_GEOSA|nr:MAM and LDL-receptor class A domain-containing protein 1-like [Geotrypetes seraphini]